MKVLDKGIITLESSMGHDMSVVRSARVSFGKDDKVRMPADERKLLNYLWKHRHTTPFESVVFTFYVKAPIFVFRQWHRHRTQSYNEVSARYKQLTNEFYIPESGLVGVQSTNNKQGRKLGSEPDSVSLSNERIQEVQLLEQHCRQSYELYEQLIGKDWPKELARMVLPVNIYSEMYTTVNLLNLLKFLTLRTDEHAQYEIRQYANAIVELIEPIVPWTIEAWREFK